MSELAAGGIRCNILMMPMIPGLTDDPSSVENVIAAARRHGAADVHCRSLFLKPSAARRFLPFIAERFPHLAEQMQKRYGDSTYAPRAYDQQLDELFQRLKCKHGFAPGHERPATPPQPHAAQLSLGLG